MSSYHVLVVDDNHEIRRMVTASIKTLGAEIDVLDVPSAEEALFISASLPLDLIVLDFRLPGMSGLEMVTRLRVRKPGIKIILVTGVEDPASRQQVTEAGVAAYFFKPIEISAFLEAVKRALGVDQEAAPAASLVPAANIASGTSPKPVQSTVVATKDPGVPLTPRFQPTPDERLSALKQQLKAISVILVNDTGQAVEMAGNPSAIVSNSVLLPALMDTFHASQKVYDALGKGTTESLLSFTNARQHIFLTSVEPSHALLVVTTGYIEPDKLGLIDRAIHLAVQDLQAILENRRQIESIKQAETEIRQAELPADITVDQETLALIDNMFSKAPKKGGKEKAEGFWETLEENGALDGKRSKDVISYEEAREMGLALTEDDKP